MKNVKCKECRKETLGSHLKEHWKEKHPEKWKKLRRWLLDLDNRVIESEFDLVKWEQWID